MASTDLAIRQPQAVTLDTEQLKFISATEFVPPGLRGNLPAILACVAMGRELGLGDMVSLKSIHVIDGKATFSAELMVMLVRRAGHSIVGDVDDEQATVTGTRIDNGDTMTVTWTLGMAEQAGLLSKQNWRKYPTAMLWARAASQLCRMLFADCFAGMTYTPEELEDGAMDSSSVVAGGLREVGSDVNDPAKRASKTEGEPEAVLEQNPPTVAQAAGPSTEPASPSAATDAQKRKLNVLVGTLRDKAYITTEEVWRYAGREPGMDDLDAEGDLHWSPLRDTLSKPEASALIEALTGIEEMHALSVQLMAAVPADRGEETRLAVVKNREAHGTDLAAHLSWLRAQVARASSSAGLAGSEGDTE